MISNVTIIYTVINVRPHDEGDGPISCHSQPLGQGVAPNGPPEAKSLECTSWKSLYSA